MKDREKIKICIPVVESSIRDALKAIEGSRPFCDLIEVRADYLKSVEIRPFFTGRSIPLIITNRRKEEGGRWGGSEEARLEVLKEAIHHGSDFVDVEVRSKKRNLFELIRMRGKTRLILSFHEFRGTPSLEKLKKLFEGIDRFQPDVIKIVTFARSFEDNLRILSLIPYAIKRRRKIVAFCMGERGRISRIFSPLLGGAWTYASLKESRRSAPGQITVEEMREVLERVGC